MVLGSIPVAVISPSDFAPASSKEFLDIQPIRVWIHSETRAWHGKSIQSRVKVFLVTYISGNKSFFFLPYAESFEKNFIKILNISFCWFQGTCGQLRKTKIGRFEAEELAVTEEKNFRLSQKKRFLEPIKKNPYIVNYYWASVSNYVYSTILVITKIYIFPLYFTSVSLLIMRSQTAWIYSCILSLLKLYRLFWFYKLDVLNIFDINIVWPYQICKFI